MERRKHTLTEAEPTESREIKIKRKKRGRERCVREKAKITEWDKRQDVQYSTLGYGVVVIFSTTKREATVISGISQLLKPSIQTTRTYIHTSSKPPVHTYEYIIQLTVFFRMWLRCLYYVSSNFVRLHTTGHVYWSVAKILIIILFFHSGRRVMHS